MNKLFILLTLLAVLIDCNCEEKESKQVLERSAPEAEGVSSQGIIDFVNSINEKKIEVHSLMFLRHEKVIAEGWWKPYGPDFRHLMYSASKSVTSLGIGIAIDEGRLNLTDKVVSFFPEYMTDSISENMKLLTVKDLLTMSVGQEQDPAYIFQRGTEDWIWGFLHTEPIHKPGTVWMYNNFATFMLSAIIQKVTGQMLFYYLEPRLFDPLDIKNIEWDFNNMGITLGMIGSRLHTEDLAKLGQLALQKGKWGDKQIVSAAYIEEASKSQISNNNQNKPEDETTDGEKGYGFQYWRGSHNSFRMDGMAGQFVLVLPDFDAVIVLTSNVGDTQAEINEVWKNLIPAMKDEILPVNTELQEELKNTLASLDWKPDLSTEIDPSLKMLVSGKRIEIEENRLGIRSMKFTFDNDKCEISINRDNDNLDFDAGLGKWNYTLTKARSLVSSGIGGMSYQRLSNEVNRDMRQMNKLAATCGINEENNLVLTVRFVEESLGAETWVCQFIQKENTTEVVVTPESGSRRIGPGGGEPIQLKGKISN